MQNVTKRQKPTTSVRGNTYSCQSRYSHQNFPNKKLEMGKMNKVLIFYYFQKERKKSYVVHMCLNEKIT